MNQTPCSHIEKLSDLRNYGWMPGSLYTTGGNNNKQPNELWRLVPLSLRKRVTVIGLPHIEGFLIASDGVRAALITLEGKYFDSHIDFLEVVADTGFNLATKVKNALKPEKLEPEPNLTLCKHYASKYLYDL